MAVANSLAAIENGARQVECNINGIGERAGNASLEEIVVALKVRSDFYKYDTAINTKEIYRTSRLVSKLTGIAIPLNKAVVGINAFSHSSGIHQDGVLKDKRTYEIINADLIGGRAAQMVLTARSGRHAVKHMLETMNYKLSEDEFENFFERFLQLADKKEVYQEDLEALIIDGITMDEPTYELDYLRRVSGVKLFLLLWCALKAMNYFKSWVRSWTHDAAYNAIDKIIKITLSGELQFKGSYAGTGCFG